MKKKLFFKLFIFAVIGALVTVTSCKDYDDDISRLDKELGDLKTELTGSITTQLNALRTELNAAIDSEVQQLTTDLNAAKARLTALETNGATKAELAAAKAEILEQTVSLTVFNTFRTEQTAQITALTTRIAALETNGATKAELAALRTEVTGFVTTLQASLDALDVRVESLETGLAALAAKHDADILDVIGQIALLRGELDPRIAAIESILEIADGESAYLNGLEDQLAEQLGLITANTAALEALEADLQAKYDELVAADAALLDQIEANYTELDAKITLNADAIDALEERVDAIEEDIEAINDRIDALEADLNMKIATLFTIAKNRLTSISLAPNAYVDGIEAVKFTTLIYKPMLADENAVIPATGYNMSKGASAIASYKFNPRTFALGNADYAYVNRTAEIITRATANDLVEIDGAPEYKAVDGTVNFTLRRVNVLTTEPEEGEDNFITLEATLKGAALAEGETGVVIAAHQELVYDQILDANDVRISDKATLVSGGDNAHYPTTFAAAVAGQIWYTDMTYDKVYNLKEKVATCLIEGGHAEMDLEDYGFTYRFAVASSDYNIVTGSTTTNQQEWIELVDANEGTFKAEDFSKEAIGRTPIMKVELLDASGNVVRRAFVKVQISVKKTEDILVGKSAYDLALACDDAEAEYELNEMFIRENVYRVITNTQGETSLSHEEFWNLYEFDNAVVKKNNVLAPAITAPVIVDGDTGTGTATKKIVWAFEHGQVGTVGANGAQLVATLTVKNKLTSSEYPEYVTFRFVVNVTNPSFTLEKVENAVYWKNDMFQVNIAIPTTPQSPANGAVFRTDLTQAYSTYDVEFTPDVAECVTSEFKVLKTFANGVETKVGTVSTPLPGVKIDGNDITLDKFGANAAAVKAALNSAGGLQAVVVHVYTYPNGDKVTVNEFMVNFIRPVTLNTQTPAEVTDAIDNGDIADFQWPNLLTDWRGNAIIAPEWEWTIECHGFWQFDHIMEYEYVPGYQRIVTPASLNVTYGEVSFTVAGAPVTMWTGTQTWQIQKRQWFGSWGSWQDYGSPIVLTSEAYLTQSEVDNDLQVQSTEIDVPNDVLGTQYQLVLDVATAYTSEEVTEGQLVEYTYVQSITYVPAVYEDVEGEWIPKAYEPSDYPNADGTEDGERNGDWVWHEWCHPDVDYTPGQYWDFYGPFGQLTANLGDVTTNLDYNGGELPVSVTLTQIGNTIKYVNVGAPIGYEYEIYIPATITYGWGTLSTVLTIVVNPSI